VVTREDLRERLWKSDTFVDFEHGLNTAVKKARQALGDSADAPEFIETLARKGYRFIGRLEPANGSDALVTTPPVEGVAPPVSHQRPSWIPRLAVWGAAALVLLGGAVGIWFVLHPAKTPQLAVMPFSVLPESGGDADYLRVGIADAITTRLANTRQIAVRPTSAVLRFKDAQSDPAQVASALGVSHLLLGSIQPAQDGYRISVQLVSADGVVVWGRSFHAALTAVPQLHDDIAQDVLAALRVELSPTERARVYARYTDSPAAYEMYLRGRSLLVNYTEAKMREAIACFQEALRIDPTFARARAGIATASAWFSVRYSHEPESRVWGKRADEEARLALEQDGSLADAHYAIASAAGTEYGGFDWEVMLDRTATALALDPSLDLAHLARMRVYYHLGLFDEARREGRLAHTVNPGPNTEFDRLEIASLLFTGQFDSAVEQATAHQSRTDIPAVPHYLGLAQYYAGDGPGARATLASITRHGRPDVRAQASLASIEAALGIRDQARARVADILRGSELDHHTAYSVGAALVQLDDLNAGLDWLERAAVTGFPCYPWYERDTLLDPLRRHPGFVQLLGRLRDGHEQARRLAQSSARSTRGGW
jgi:TolB-like protein